MNALVPVGTMDERDVALILYDLHRAQVVSPSEQWQQRSIIISYLTMRLELARRPENAA